MKGRSGVALTQFCSSISTVKQSTEAEAGAHMGTGYIPVILPSRGSRTLACTSARTSSCRCYRLPCSAHKHSCLGVEELCRRIKVPHNRNHVAGVPCMSTARQSADAEAGTHMKTGFDRMRIRDEYEGVPYSRRRRSASVLKFITQMLQTTLQPRV